MARYHGTFGEREMRGSYEDRDDIRRIEREDASMVPSGNGAHANMPSELVMKSYGEDDSYLPEGLDDTIKGISAQKNLDNSKKKAHLAPKKI